MHHQPQGDSIWGNINTVVEIAINVYYIFAENGEGIMIPKEKAGDIISEKAASMGKEDNGYLCYGRDENMEIPMYEVLQKRVDACERIRQKALEQMEEIKREGNLRLTDYFGECDPPGTTPEGKADNHQKVRNGIYFVETGDMAYFAVQETVADNFLSPMACVAGEKKDGYIYYDLTTSAIPLNELRQVYSEIDSLIVSEDSLKATLVASFPTYLSAYNSIVQEEARIPPIEAPVALFLQQQLDVCQNIVDIEQSSEQVADYFGEQVEDYGFEP